MGGRPLVLCLPLGMWLGVSLSKYGPGIFVLGGLKSRALLKTSWSPGTRPGPKALIRSADRIRAL